MGLYHIFTGTAGEACIETIDLNKRPDLTELQSAEGFWLAARSPQPPPSPQLPEPGRRLHVMLSGRMEVTLGDGSKYVFGPGDARLIEDTTGHGHAARYLEPSSVIIIELDPGSGPWTHPEIPNLPMKMRIPRLYSGPDGESHVDEVDVDGHPEYKDFQPIEGIWLAKRPTGPPSPLTPEPAPRWMVLLSGAFEVGFGDGRYYQYRAPALRFVEDTTGAGHTSQFLEESAMIVIELKPGFGPWLSEVRTWPS